MEMISTKEFVSSRKMLKMKAIGLSTAAWKRKVEAYLGKPEKNFKQKWT